MLIDKKKKKSKMKYKKLKLSAFLLLGFGLTSVTAQESVNATGGNASGSGGSASYSIGQITYQTITGNNVSVTQGVQQPIEISVITELEEAKNINLSVTAFPNPSADHLTLQIGEFEISNLSYQLYDANGKILLNEKITGNPMNIATNHLAPANYFVKVMQGNKEVKTFKITKN
jgi:hypothetical protein